MEPSVSELVRNFVGQYRRPFSLEQMSELLMISKRKLHPIVLRLVEKGEIREASKGIYLAGQRPLTHGTAHYRQRTWIYRVESGKRILDLLEMQPQKTVREVAALMAVSRQYVYVYLEALASIGAVTYRDKHWITTGRGELSALGCKVERGVLSRLRKEARDECESRV